MAFLLYWALPYLSPLQSAAIEISNFVCLTPLVSLQTLPPLSEISNHPFWLAIEHNYSLKMQIDMIITILSQLKTEKVMYFQKQLKQLALYYRLSCIAGNMLSVSKMQTQIWCTVQNNLFQSWFLNSEETTRRIEP